MRYIVKTNEQTFLPVRLLLPGAMERTTFPSGHIMPVGRIQNGPELTVYIFLLLTHLVGKPEGKKPLGKPTCRWEDNIKMYLQEVG